MKTNDLQKGKNMYCINCGVKLADSEKVCPLCNTKVYHPDLFIKHAPSPYPAVNTPVEHISRRGIAFILSIIFIIPLLLLPFIDLKLNGGITWSGMAGLGILLSYIIAVLPIWFKKPNPIVFVPLDFAATGGFLLYIDLYFVGGWFMTFAFPMCCIFGGITTAATVLFRYIPRGRLYIWSGIVYALGASCILIEMFLNISFKIRAHFAWSIYPAVATAVIGSALLVIAICKPIREALGKRFFI